MGPFNMWKRVLLIIMTGPQVRHGKPEPLYALHGRLSFFLFFKIFLKLIFREINIDLLFHLFMHLLVHSCMCPDWRLNPQHIVCPTRKKLSATEHLARAGGLSDTFLYCHLASLGRLQEINVTFSLTWPHSKSLPMLKRTGMTYRVPSNQMTSGLVLSSCPVTLSDSRWLWRVFHSSPRWSHTWENMKIDPESKNHSHVRPWRPNSTALLF